MHENTYRDRRLYIMDVTEEIHQNVSINMNNVYLQFKSEFKENELASTSPSLYIRNLQNVFVFL